MEGGRAFGQTGKLRVFVQPGARLSMECSLPKLLADDNRRLVWGPDELEEAGRALADELASLGIEADIGASILSRLDVARDVLTAYQIPAYVPMLQRRVRQARQQPKGTYASTYAVGNGERMTRFYGKREELHAQGVDVTHIPPTLRVEHEVKGRRNVRANLGCSTYADLVAAPLDVVEGYQKQMLRILPEEPAPQPITLMQPTKTIQTLNVTPESLEEVFRRTKEGNPRGWVQSGYAALGMAYLEAHGYLPSAADAVRAVAAETAKDGGRQAAYRAGKLRGKLADGIAAADVELAQLEAMYGEIRGALLAEV